MKISFRNLLFIMLMACVIDGCQDKLVENPTSLLTPNFFKSTQGFESGLVAAYAGMRSFYGRLPLVILTVGGTDEFQSGHDAGSNSNVMGYTPSFDPTYGVLSSVWDACYTYINTCNGLIDNASTVHGIDPATKNEMVAEAKFLRAYYYFIAVQFWGDVTLNKHFQSVPVTSAARAPIADVYAFIIQDLKNAIAGLSPSPQLNGVLPGRATGAAARHLLAKVYLTRAYSSAKQPNDFDSAYTTAKNLINDASSLGLGLLPDFAQVFAQGNEGNKEVLWSVQYTSDLAYNSSGNQDCFYWTNFYNLEPGMERDLLNGRGWARVCPTRWLTDTAFKDKIRDSRYNKTFQTVWYCNNTSNIPVWPGTLPPGAPADAVPGQPKFALGDTAIYMPGHDVTDAEIAASPYLLVPPRNYTNALYPGLNKYTDTKRTDANAVGNRPVIVFRLAGTYLIAAEAAFMDGHISNAVSYINTVRERAASNSINPHLMDISSTDISLDFILDERARELCGEQMRWWDLARTHKLLERVRLHNPEAAPNIQEKDILRPIPQSQIDLTSTGEKYPQNQGW